MSVVFLDICEHSVGGRNVDVTDIQSIIPSSDGCYVALKSIGVVKVRQSVDELSQKILESVNKKGVN